MYEELQLLHFLSDVDVKPLIYTECQQLNLIIIVFYEIQYAALVLSTQQKTKHETRTLSCN